MKILTKLFLVLFIIFKFSLVNAEVNIVFLDMNKVLTNSKIGKATIEKFKKINNENIAKFKKIEEKLRKEESEIISQKNILSVEIYDEKIKKFKKKVNEYNLERNSISTNFKKDKSENVSKLINLINPILVSYSNEKSYSLILKKESIIIGKNDLDITNDLIDLVNKKIKNF